MLTSLNGREARTASWTGRLLAFKRQSSARSASRCLAILDRASSGKRAGVGGTDGPGLPPVFRRHGPAAWAAFGGSRVFGRRRPTPFIGLPAMPDTFVKRKDTQRFRCPTG